MCISYDNGVAFGESWTAAVTPITTPLQEEAAWPFNDDNAAIAAGDPARQIDDQWAASELFSTNAQNATPPDAGAANQLNLAGSEYGSEPSSFYEKFVIYVPVEGAGPKEISSLGIFWESLLPLSLAHLSCSAAVCSASQASCIAKGVLPENSLREG